ncbi:MAG TPA: YtxH domain-containing protein [Dehalococcoidia bacterium]|jgi:gas vesicle protein|nr:YtxH domain-containing protein [Dehalococcoidia bacterium]
MRFIIGLLLGIAAGAALGLIMAPQSGKETRESLRKRVQSNTTDGVEEPVPVA